MAACAVLACSIGYMLALCVANRPRFWWQEALCSHTLYWMPLALIAFGGLVIFNCRRRAPLVRVVSLLAVGCYGYVITSAAATLLPYASFHQWPEVSDERAFTVSGIWVDEWSQSDRSTELERIITEKGPTLVMVSGEFSPALLTTAIAQRFPHQARTESVERGGITILSSLPFRPDPIDELGIEAFPGGLFILEPPNHAAIELGVMTLERSTSQEVFERNRITSRRLSSLMRNSHQPRIVAAQFSTTPFSQLMGVYPRQARLRSVMYGLGLFATFRETSGRPAAPQSNIFISRDFARKNFERIDLAGPRRDALFFALQMANAR